MFFGVPPSLVPLLLRLLTLSFSRTLLVLSLSGPDFCRSTLHDSSANDFFLRHCGETSLVLRDKERFGRFVRGKTYLEGSGDFAVFKVDPVPDGLPNRRVGVENDPASEETEDGARPVEGV